MSQIEQRRAEFKEYIKKMKSYEETLELLAWDLRTGAPRKGIEQRSETIGVLSTQLFNMSTSEEMEKFLEELSESSVFEQLDEMEKRMVKESKKEFDRSKKIPADKYQEYVVLTSKAESVWEEAKEKSDFSVFKPYLEKIVEMNREFIELWGYEGHKYNTLLDMYEPGLTVEKLDEVFGALKDRIVPLVAEIKEKGQATDNSFVFQEFTKEEQKRFSLFMLEQMGYDFNAGRLDEAVHPFAVGLNPGDVRITTMYRTHDMSSALFSTMHEGGHALYEQNIGENLVGTTLATGTSMGIHESQSRLWENMVGRTRSFWERYYKDLQENFSGKFDDVSMEQFYKGINQANPTLIRIDADELTYNLHIMIRYELEKALFSGELSVDELPQAWNQKYQEYLGVEPKHNGEGVLQDVHWSGGGFGYFPSYSLGNMYAAQFLNTLKQQVAFDDLLREGNLAPIKEWLTDQIYKYGKSLTPNEIVQQVTGEELNPTYLIDYLEEKFRDIYSL